MSKCSSVHISQPPGMLLAPRIRPTRVPGRSSKPATSGVWSTACTARPVDFWISSSTIRARAVGGTITVPAAYSRPPALNAAPARNVGTSHFCRLPSSLAMP